MSSVFPLPEYGKMAVNLKDKFDSLIEKSFHDTDSKPQRQRQSVEAKQRVSYSSQLTDTSESEDGDGESDSASSQSSYEQPKKKLNSRRGRPKGSSSKKVSEGLL